MMATCPDCGSIVMEGDPYCSHCGAHLQWSDDTTESENSTGSVADVISNEIIASPEQKAMLAQKVLELLQAKDTDIETITIDYGSASFVFIRRNIYITTVVTCVFKYMSEGPAVFESVNVENDLSNLTTNESFRNSVAKVESETGKRLSHIDGGYDVKTSLTGDPVFEDNCTVSAFFKSPQGGYEQYFLDLETMRLTRAMDYLAGQLRKLSGR